MKLTIKNITEYAIENGYNNLRKRDGKGYYLDYSSYRTTGHYYCATLKIAVYVIKNGLVFDGCEVIELDGVITGLHQSIDQESELQRKRNKKEVAFILSIFFNRDQFKQAMNDYED